MINGGTAVSFVQRHANAVLFAGVTVGVFITRLPFLAYGPGRDPDAWRLLYAGISIAETGRYSMSRPPGYPIPEYIYSFDVSGNAPLVPLVALLGALGIAFFALAARRIGCNMPWLAAAAVAMTPVVYVNGTNLMDYTWALAFVMAAYYFVLADRPVTAGVLTGIAVGCRLTSGVMLIPFSILTLLSRRPFDRRAVVRTIRLWIACLVLSGLCYTPVLLTYGSKAMHAADEGRAFTQVLNVVGEGIWGSVGLIAIVIGAATLIVRWFAKGAIRSAIPGSLPECHVWSWLAVLILYTASFLRLPHEAGYLIIIVPFVILFFARFLPRQVFVLVCVLLIVSPAINIGKEGFKMGPVESDMRSRSYYLEETGRIISSAVRLTGQNVIFAGWLAPQLRVAWHHANLSERNETVFEMEMPDPLFNRYIEEGKGVYVLPNALYYADVDKAERLLQKGAEPLYYRSSQKKAKKGFGS